MLNRIMSEKNLYENEDPMWQMRMQMLMKRKRNMEIAQTIDNALEEWYSERGRPVPQWKKEKQQWWREYLISLGLDPNNP
ncbi:hypothetical protein SWYG_00090 [Synechococcus phage S-IOM18]|uniref:Uncharacterized protein n=1 Tax=Synechococcus phage S-IOM18 TaxID=754039 RepID=R9TM01_9CAUD|nr:hypothetical protein SWYG_00090 [Synechococcus phage S-IOM18]AGN33601.1 hypothetical protein SWYG_00090 [Synechococcus phage S-IOM18]